MHDGTLDHALKPERGLRVHLILTRHHRCVVFDEVLQVLANLFDITGTGTQHLSRRRIVQQGQ